MRHRHAPVKVTTASSEAKVLRTARLKLKDVLYRAEWDWERKPTEGRARVLQRIRAEITDLELQITELEEQHRLNTSVAELQATAAQLESLVKE